MSNLPYRGAKGSSNPSKSGNDDNRDRPNPKKDDKPKSYDGGSARKVTTASPTKPTKAPDSPQQKDRSFEDDPLHGLNKLEISFLTRNTGDPASLSQSIEFLRNNDVRLAVSEWNQRARSAIFKRRFELARQFLISAQLFKLSKESERSHIEKLRNRDPSAFRHFFAGVYSNYELYCGEAEYAGLLDLEKENTIGPWAKYTELASSAYKTGSGQQPPDTKPRTTLTSGTDPFGRFSPLLRDFVEINDSNLKQVRDFAFDQPDVLDEDTSQMQTVALECLRLNREADAIRVIQRLLLITEAQKLESRRERVDDVRKATWPNTQRRNVLEKTTKVVLDRMRDKLAQSAYEEEPTQRRREEDQDNVGTDRRSGPATGLAQGRKTGKQR